MNASITYWRKLLARALGHPAAEREASGAVTMAGIEGDRRPARQRKGADVGHLVTASAALEIPTAGGHQGL